MVIPAQRLSDLESAAWQTDKRLDRIETSLFDLREKAEQHAIALSATMKDLRDLRIDVGRMTKVLDDHTAMLEAIVKHFGIEVPLASAAEIAELADLADAEAAAA
jgi:hypothetical protein